MAKSNNRSSNKTSNKRTTVTSVNNPRKGRPAVMTPKAGVTVNRRRVKDGGEWCW